MIASAIMMNLENISPAFFSLFNVVLIHSTILLKFKSLTSESKSVNIFNSDELTVADIDEKCT